MRIYDGACKKMKLGFSGEYNSVSNPKNTLTKTVYIPPHKRKMEGVPFNHDQRDMEEDNMEQMGDIEELQDLERDPPMHAESRPRARRGLIIHLD